MNQVFDLIAEIAERTAEFVERTGYRASSVFLSPLSYRRLLEIQAQENAIGNLIIGCASIAEIAIPGGTLRVIIDEMLSDTDVVVA